MTTQIILDLSDPDGVQQEVDLSPEEQAAHDALVGGAREAQASSVFAASDDAERLAIINERASTDPAYAALADYVLRGVQR